MKQHENEHCIKDMLNYFVKIYQVSFQSYEKCVSRKGCGAKTTPALVLRYNFAVKILASHVTVTRQTFLLGAEPEVGMSPICSKRYLFFFLAVLKFVAYFSSLCCQFFSFYAARALSHWRRIGPNLSFPSEFRMPWTF